MSKYDELTQETIDAQIERFGYAQQPMKVLPNGLCVGPAWSQEMRKGAPIKVRITKVGICIEKSGFRTPFVVVNNEMYTGHMYRGVYKYKKDAVAYMNKLLKDI